MSVEKRVRIQAIDDTTPVLLGMARTIRSIGREIMLFSRLLHALAEAELIAAAGATALGRAISIGIPIIGLVAGLLSIFAAVQATRERAIIPVGQTAAGQFRPILSTGTIRAHAGEIIGRPQDISEAGFGGRVNITMHNTFVMNPAGQRPEEIARKLALDMKREFRSITSE